MKNLLFKIATLRQRKVYKFMFPGKPIRKLRLAWLVKITEKSIQFFCTTDSQSELYALYTHQ